MIEFPPEFELEYYRQIHAEIQSYPYDDLIQFHYQKYAKEMGLTSCCYDRREYLLGFLKENLSNEKILEIAPYDRPLFRGDNVKYFDVLDSEQLKNRKLTGTREEGDRHIDRIPEKIHYVEPFGDMSIIDEQFDIVASSHVIEHQPDLLRHLLQVENLLVSGGYYILLIPDKRYCFDHFRNESNAAEVIAAHIEERKIHPLVSLIEHYSMNTHNSAFRHWADMHGEPGLNKERLVQAIDDYIAADGKYISVHSWKFTPDSFGNIMRTLHDLGLLKLELHRLCHTIFGRVEFIAILRKPLES